LPDDRQPGAGDVASLGELGNVREPEREASELRARARRVEAGDLKLEAVPSSDDEVQRSLKALPQEAEDVSGGPRDPSGDPGEEADDLVERSGDEVLRGAEPVPDEGLHDLEGVPEDGLHELPRAGEDPDDRVPRCAPLTIDDREPGL